MPDKKQITPDCLCGRVSCPECSQRQRRKWVRNNLYKVANVYGRTVSIKLPWNNLPAHSNAILELMRFHSAQRSLEQWLKDRFKKAEIAGYEGYPRLFIIKDSDGKVFFPHIHLCVMLVEISSGKLLKQIEGLWHDLLGRKPSIVQVKRTFDSLRKHLLYGKTRPFVENEELQELIAINVLDPIQESCKGNLARCFSGGVYHAANFKSLLRIWQGTYSGRSKHLVQSAGFISPVGCCFRCGVIGEFIRHGRKGGRQRWKCTACGTTCVLAQYAQHIRYPPPPEIEDEFYWNPRTAQAFRCPQYFSYT